MKKIPSIFNDVLSPITPGPSSSNTCAPSRIARAAFQIFGRRPDRVLVEMSDTGGYVSTFYGMQSDLAFLAGFLDKDPLQYDLSKAYEDAAACGLEIEYRFVPHLPPLPSEMCRMTLTSSDAASAGCEEAPGSRAVKTMQMTATSIGGGSFVISEIDGCETDIRGDQYQVLLFLKSIPAQDLLSQIEGMHPGINSVSFCPGPNYGILDVKYSREPSASQVCQLQALLPEPLLLRTVMPAYEIVFNKDAKPPFTTPTGLIDYAARTGVPLWQAAVDYESALSGWSSERVLAYAEKLYDICSDGMNKGLAGGFTFEGITDPKAPKLSQGFEEKPLIPCGIGRRGAAAALAIMEHSNARGTIVCMPTGGSSGVVPGSIFGAVSEMGLSKEDGIRALLTAGMIGAFLFETDYTGFYGCQAEIGCATGMAAAALCTLICDDAESACAAASLAIQSLLGLLCDPIGGYVQVPCLIRNMTAVPTAAVCANAAACGFPATVPLEEMCDAILRVGKQLRTINCLGACATPTGCRLEEACIKNKNQAR